MSDSKAVRDASGRSPLYVVAKQWRSDRPPNETWVEVLDGESTVEAMAFYGRDGYRPHWQLRDGTCCDPSTFSQWREVASG